jgi:hypothetical protein
MKSSILPKKGEIFDTNFFVRFSTRLQPWDFSGVLKLTQIFLFDFPLDYNRGILVDCIKKYISKRCFTPTLLYYIDLPTESSVANGHPPRS